MRWKLTRDGNNMYVCCGCLHVRTGTVYLGIAVLLWEVAVLGFLSCLVVRPDVIPPWVMHFIQTSGEMKVKPRYMVGGHGNMMGGFVGGRGMMIDDDGILPVRNLSESPDSSLLRGGIGSRGDMRHSLEDMPHMNGILPGEWSDMPHMNGNDMPRDWKDMPHRVEGMPHMKGDLSDMPHKFDQVGIKVEDAVLKQDAQVNTGDNDNDDRPLMSEILVDEDGSIISDHPFRPKIDLLNSEDKLFFFVMVLCCIASAFMLIYGVIKGRSGYMIPFMGLQVFDFCATGLMVFTCFSYVPNLKQWIAELPDSFPYKACLMSADTDRLMLSIVLSAVALLVTKAYLMGMVWSCYKYLTTQLTSGATGRHRSADEADIARNPEDSELLLPPKYEDIVNEPAASSLSSTMVTDSDGSQPPPYVATP